jgi:outer membrane protein
MNKTLLSLATVAALACGGNAFATDLTFQAGYVNINPNSSATAANGPFTPVDALSLKVKSQGTLYLSLVAALDDNWSAQFAFGVPPKHDVTLVVLKPSAVTPSVAAADGQVIAKITQSNPTGFINYNFGDKNSAWRPFVGLGVNYTSFTQRDSTPTNDAINGGPTSIKLKDSWGLAAQVGVTYKFDAKWSATAALATAKVSTTETTNTLGIVRTAKIDFHPAALSLAVGYTF